MPDLDARIILGGQMPQIDVAQAQQQALQTSGMQAQAQERIAKAKEAAEAKKANEALRERLSRLLKKDEETGLSKYDLSADPELIAALTPEMRELVNAANADVDNIHKQRQATVKRSAEVVAMSQYNPAVFDSKLDFLERNGQVEPQVIAAIRERVKQDPTQIKVITDQFRGMTPQGPEKGVVVGDNSTLVNPTSGAVMYQGTPKPEHSPIYKEYQDAIASGYKGSFEDYQNADANRRKSVVNVNTGGGQMSQGDKKLIEAVMKNPSLFKTLTPTVASRIAAGLSEAGFDFSADASGKPPTGVQRQTLSFFTRANNAAEDLEKLEPEIAKLSLMGQAGMAMLPNFMQSQTGQSYTAAQRAFTEARLRKDSGAAIPEQEFANDRRTYFVQPGDSAETIAQKKRGRAAILASLAYGAGPAFTEFYGDDAKDLMAKYRGEMGGKTAAKEVATGDLPKGTTFFATQNGVKYEITTDASGKIISQKVVK